MFAKSCPPFVRPTVIWKVNEWDQKLATKTPSGWRVNGACFHSRLLLSAHNDHFHPTMEWRQNARFLLEDHWPWSTLPETVSPSRPTLLLQIPLLSYEKSTTTIVFWGKYKFEVRCIGLQSCLLVLYIKAI